MKQQIIAEKKNERIANKKQIFTLLIVLCRNDRTNICLSL